MLDLVPDECSEYYETNIKFERFMKGMKVTHRYCSETREMQPIVYFQKKASKELEKLWTDLGGES